MSTSFAPVLFQCFTMVLLLVLFGCNPARERDFRGNLEQYEEFMTRQSTLLVDEILEGDCRKINNRFLISGTDSAYNLNCNLLEGLRSDFTDTTLTLSVSVHYSYLEIPELIVTRVDQKLLHRDDTLQFHSWFYSNPDIARKSFDSTSTSAVSLVVNQSGQKIYYLAQGGANL